MKDKQVGLDVKCTYWWMMAHLLTDDSHAKVWPATDTEQHQAQTDLKVSNVSSRAVFH